jgi:ankyrin repeat protein
MAGKLSQPSAPLAQKITHHSIELSWSSSLDNAYSEIGKRTGDSRVKVQLQQLSAGFTEQWKAVYVGFGKGCLLETLVPWSQYKYRIQFSIDSSYSDWSPEVIYTTLKEPLHGDNVHKAILTQDISFLKHVLYANEAPLDAPDKYGFTPLMQTAQHGFLEMMELLIENGADVNLQNDIGKTALMLAAFAGKLPAVKTLRQYGAKYNLQDIGGSTALHWACDSQNAELVDWMLRDGADVSAVDINGRTPLLHLAAVSGNRQIATVLVRHGADINAIDKNKQTALLLGTLNGHVDMIEFLLDRNADVTAVNEYGNTAYDMALSRDKKAVAKCLEEYMDRQGIHHR